MKFRGAHEAPDTVAFARRRSAAMLAGFRLSVRPKFKDDAAPIGYICVIWLFLMQLVEVRVSKPGPSPHAAPLAHSSREVLDRPTGCEGPLWPRQITAFGPSAGGPRTHISNLHPRLRRVAGAICMDIHVAPPVIGEASGWVVTRSPHAMT